MHKIALWGYGKPLLGVLPCLQKAGFIIEYIKVDYQRAAEDNWEKCVCNYGIKLFVDDIPDIELDAIFVINYNRLISNDILDKYLVVNYHVGLLPKWRGNSANGWAIINGANELGYTIHRVTEILDDGPIYYQYSFLYEEGETYYKARMAMNEDLVTKLPNVLHKVIMNPQVYKNIMPEDFVYCVKFRPTDGVINWNNTTEQILRKFYVFGPPLGTGLTFSHSGNNYTIKSLSRINGYAPSIGVAGSVVYKDDNSIWIKTGDTAISVSQITDCDGNDVDISLVFKIGHRL